MFGKLLTTLRIAENRKYHVYSDFKEELSEMISYLSEKKPDHFEESLKSMKAIERCLVPKPDMPTDIERQIDECCNLMVKENGLERCELYGYGNGRHSIMSTEEMGAARAIGERTYKSVEMNSPLILQKLKEMKNDGMKTIWHHTHNDLCWPSSLDYDRMRELSTHLDVGIVTRFGFGTAYIDTSKISPDVYEMSYGLGKVIFQEHMGKFYGPLKPPQNVLDFYMKADPIWRNPPK